MLGDRVGRFPRWLWPAGRSGVGSSRDAATGSAIMSQPGLTANRFLLWVDGVGGYLVCRDDVLMVGQAVPGSRVAIPLLGDLSRQHAILERLGGRYVVRPLEPTWVDGQAAEGPTLLQDGSRIDMGRSVSLRFRQPHALSNSARLEFLSRHKTLLGIDGVVLMGESCLLGSSSHNHIVCRDWRSDVVLFRKNGGLGCRAAAPFEVNGIECVEACQLPIPSRVVGRDFSFSLEALS